jgi:hypothetical protein
MHLLCVCVWGGGYAAAALCVVLKALQAVGKALCLAMLLVNICLWWLAHDMPCSVTAQVQDANKLYLMHLCGLRGFGLRISYKRVPASSLFSNVQRCCQPCGSLQHHDDDHQ